MTQQGRNMEECVTIDDKTLFVHLLVISVCVLLFIFCVVSVYIRSSSLCLVILRTPGNGMNSIEKGVSSECKLYLHNHIDHILCKDYKCWIRLFRLLPFSLLPTDSLLSTACWHALNFNTNLLVVTLLYES
jgi:hypothetical protein